MLYIITTGGTIEGLEYDDENQRNSEGISIETFLSQLEISIPYHIEKVLDKDSRFVTEEDRELIATKVSNCQSDNVLITHGTLTMVETAKYLGRLEFNKTIVLTGAFILGTEPDTDAPSNLDFAIAAFEDLENGVYIAMHDTIFQWNAVRKNHAKNRFECIQ